MSPTDGKYRLTDEHRAQLGGWAEKWIANALNTTPMDETDRDAMREAVAGMYRAAGLKPPVNVVFAPSPLVAAIAAGVAAGVWHLRDGQPPDVDPAVTAATCAALRAATEGAAVAATDHVASEAAVRQATDAATWAATWAATLAVTQDATDAVTDAIADADAVRFLLRCIGESWRIRQGGNQWSGPVAFVSFFDRVVGLDLPEYADWRHWEAAAIHGGVRYVHPKFCIVADRPIYIRRDNLARPHAEDGPFCEWSDHQPDGHRWRLWAWHGVLVPEWVITDPTPERIAAEPNTEIRRCAIESYGWDRYLSIIDATLVDAEADPGNPGQELALYDLPDAGQVYGDPVRLLVMSNASLDRDGTRRRFAETVPVEIGGAVAAAAWQSRVPESTYRKLARAT